MGLTAGASAPDELVFAVVNALAPTAGVETVQVTTEGEYFPLPRDLRGLLVALQAAVEGGYACRMPGRKGDLDRDREWTANEALQLLAECGYEVVNCFIGRRRQEISIDEALQSLAVATG